jgi:hypothetical protein
MAMKREHDAALHGEGQEGSGMSSPSKRHAAADEKMNIHIEVYTTPTSTAQPRRVEEQVLALLQRRAGAYVEGMRIECDEQAEAALGNDVEAINVCEIESASMKVDADAPAVADQVVPFTRASHYVHISQLCDEGPTVSDLDMGGDSDEGSDVPACQQYLLPSREFHGVWDSLVFDTGVKDELLAYAQTAMLFADRGVDTNLVGFNRVILLHGPPGTGKTSLCKALAQKLSVRMSHRYTSGVMIEVNAHSLFSRWFSESGKMVLKLFESIRELAESDPDCFCAVVIDEVESLSASRSAAASGNEPSDAVRVVNALLTQLDTLKRFANCLVLTTSNVTKAIDGAFVDRADLKVYVGNPSACGIYEILRSAIAELARTGLVSIPREYSLLRGRACQQLFAAEHTKSCGSDGGQCTAPEQPMDFETSSSTDSQRLSLVERASLLVYNAALECEEAGLSGRTMRKLPFLAHALYCGRSSMPFSQYVVCLRRAAAREKQCRADMDAAVLC